MNIYEKSQKKHVNLPQGASAKDLAEKLHQTGPNEALAVQIGDAVQDLSSTLQEGQEVSLVHFHTPEGKNIYWHTSAHVLAQAVLRLWPEAKPTIGPAIDQGFYYDFANVKISDEDFAKIEKEMETIVSENHKPQRKCFSSRQEALETFSHNPYKMELIKEFPDGPITSYQQGEFFDLCRGPHLPNLGKIKAIKILKTSGAYWRGDSSKEMLTRIYGISFPEKKQLKEYLHLLEEAKKRDHKILGPKLGIFSLEETAPGMPFIQPRGMIIWNTLIQFWRNLHAKEDYEEIKTPQLMSQQLWEMSGHWEHYRENMYAFHIEDRHYAIKPMNCPGCMLYYRSSNHSYRDLPLRITELGHVHRHEASGALSGLFRVRSFHQDDAHLFLKPEDIKSEILRILVLAEKIYSTFGLEHRFELSTRPEKSVGSDAAWEIATKGLKDALDEWGHPYRVNEGDGAFYGPKIDIHIKDALGRSWQCGTVQLDMALPEKFSLTYMDRDGQEKRPVVVHRALFGSVERFLGILIEHFAGRFPLWISPLQVRILTVADRHIPYAEEVKRKIQDTGLLCDIDASQESISKKVRNAQLLQVNYMLTVGDKETETNTISLRTRDNIVHGSIEIKSLLQELLEEKTAKALHSPFSQRVVL